MRAWELVTTLQRPAAKGSRCLCSLEVVPGSGVGVGAGRSNELGGEVVDTGECSVPGTMSGNVKQGTGLNT